jgi:hypothetical protein
MQNTPDDALLNLCSLIMREFADEILPGKDLLDFAISSVSASDRRAALSRIEKALNCNLSDKELKRLWLGSGASIAFEPTSRYRDMFIELKNRLEGKPASFRL